MLDIHDPENELLVGFPTHDHRRHTTTNDVLDGKRLHRMGCQGSSLDAKFEGPHRLRLTTNGSSPSTFCANTLHNLCPLIDGQL